MDTADKRTKTEFQHAGLTCGVTLTSMGHYCGYVAIPEGHPLYGKHYSDSTPVPASTIERPIDVDKVGIINLFCQTEVPSAESCPVVLAFDVHGGLTFASADQERPLWWFGFDCAHSGDGRNEGEPGWKDREFAEAETRSLAEQLAAFAA
jgi:hypothetical protein